ncbi:ParA family partition ATPase [Azospirillum halopraeferens]|uniref:ParA family partition ATPase n=1 Tax=Azospirillum halopraeferens TaxID=34010 RepID=UPI000414A34A|nr:ParA family partition ATPase [Azospirillum halopraeferens]
MAGKVFTVAQQKGGAGKTTLAAHLAIAWTQLGHSVATVDIDPQGSLTRWFQVRRDATGGEPGFHHVQLAGWRTQGEVERLARDHDVVVIDSPPHAQTEARIAVRAGTLVIAPVQPSPMDLWAVHPTLDLARQEKRRLLLVLNRVPPRARIADELVAQVRALVAPPDVELAEAQVGNRTAYAGTLMTGLSVTEAARRTQAAAEMQALAQEILDRAG